MTWPPSAAAIRILTRITCVVCAVATLGLIFLASVDIYLTGFPDSHLTDYDKAADAPKRILVGVEWGLVLLFAALAVLPISVRARAVGSVSALLALVVVALLQWIGIPWYFLNHLGLDNGIGG